MGVCLILAGSCGIGWHSAASYAIRIRILGEWEQALQFLYGEIEYAGSDLIEILEELEGRGNYMQLFWKSLCQMLIKRDGNSLSVHWEREIKNIKNVNCLCKEDLLLWKTIGQNIGNLDRETQLHTLMIFQKRIQESLLQAKKTYAGKAKVSCVLGAVSGLFLTILLL